jgi:DNA-nicking Smr family endonuclease
MSRRRLSDEERAVWKGFVRSVEPLREHGSGDDRQNGPQPGDSTILPRPAVPQGRGKTKELPPLAQLDRRLRQRVARGHTTIDARLDLHGMTQTQAHAALLRFLHDAQAQDAKLALVVTGKGLGRGAAGAVERGVLRRQVPLWLSLPEFRRFVVGFEAAHGSHGGEGALYLRLRRRVR